MKRRLDPYRMTFDQLQRYRLAAELIEFLRDKKPLLILDAGSREGFLRTFLPEDMIVNLDRTTFSINNFIHGNILELPYPDGALDVTLALDVLEHVPSAQRTTLLNEMARVTKDIFIVGSPFQDEKVEAAEKLVNEFCLKVTGKENEFLVEHLTEGLPRLDEVLDWARGKEYRAAILPNAYLYRWTMMICLNEYLSQLAEPWDVIFGANDFYHRRFYRQDNTEPSYRKIIVCSKSGKINPQALREKFAGFPAEKIDPGILISFMEKLTTTIDSEKDNVIEKIHREKLAAQKKLKSEVDKLTGIIDEKTRINNELREKLASEVKKLTGIIDEKSEDILKRNEWVRQLQAELGNMQAELGGVQAELGGVQAELEGIKSSFAYKLYKKTWGKLTR